MTLDFNRGWTFRKYGEDTGITVNLPHDAMITETRKPCLNGANSGFFPGGRYLYEKEFEIAQEDIGKYIAVFFEGVYRCAKIYLNGEQVFYHAYGYTEFTVDISDRVRAGGNIILVDADNSLEPGCRWYPGSGIYRPVQLLIKPRNYIRGVKVTTLSYNPAKIRIEAENDDACFEVLDGDGVILSGVPGEYEVENAKLWSDESPYLYTLRVFNADDAEELKFGIRYIDFAPAYGVRINGKETKFRGACIHHDNGILGACEYPDAARRRVRLLKAGGYNAIRSAHNPISRALLDAADELGVYIMDESFDQWYTPKTYHDYSRDFWANYKDDIRAMIMKDINRPSVIMYSIGNECSEPKEEKGMNLAYEMADYMKELDPTRITTMGANLMLMMVDIYKSDNKPYERKPLDPKENKDLMASLDKQGSAGFNAVMQLVPKLTTNSVKRKKCAVKADTLIKHLDVLGLNYGFPRYELDIKRDPNRIYVGSETFPSQVCTNWRLVKKYHQIVGDFCWTGWDYLGEAGSCGAFDYESWEGLPIADGAGTIDLIGNTTAENIYMQIAFGTYKKPYIAVKPVSYYGQKYQQGGWRMTNAIHSWSWQGCEGTPAEIEVYADAYSAELFLNGKSLGRKKLRDNKAIFRTKYQPGTLELVAYYECGSEAGRDVLKTCGDETVITLSADRTELKANGQDLCYLAIDLTDLNGEVKPVKDVSVTVTVEGSAVILAGLGSARTKTSEVFNLNHHLTHFGRALAVLRAGYEPGEAVITVSAGGFEEKKIIIKVM